MASEGKALVHELDRYVFPLTKDGGRRRVLGYTSPLEFGGVSGEDNTGPLKAALQTGKTVLIPDGYDCAISEDITLPRYSRIIGGAKIDQVASGGAESRITSTNGSGIVFESNCLIEGIRIDGGAKPTGSVGVQLGEPDAFRGYCVLNRVTVTGFEVGILFENVYFVEIAESSVKSCQTGLKIAPTSSGGDTGYVTTVTLRKVYVHDCDRHGIQDVSPIQSKQCTFQDVVVERCGDATYPQVELAASQGFAWTGGYIEDQTQAAVALKCIKGAYRDLYINGASIGIDGGASAFDCIFENITITSAVVLSASITGGAIAHVTFKDVDFPNAPTLSVRTGNFDRCSGSLPPNVIENSVEMTGSVVRFGIGALANSKLRQVRRYDFTENQAVAAGATQDGAVQDIGAGAIADAVVIAFPLFQLPAGIQFHAYKVDDDRFRLRYTDAGGAGGTVNGAFLVLVVRFAP